MRTPGPVGLVSDENPHTAGSTGRTGPRVMKKPSAIRADVMTRTGHCRTPSRTSGSGCPPTDLLVRRIRCRWQARTAIIRPMPDRSGANVGGRWRRRSAFSTLGVAQLLIGAALAAFGLLTVLDYLSLRLLLDEDRTAQAVECRGRSPRRPRASGRAGRRAHASAARPDDRAVLAAQATPGAESRLTLLAVPHVANHTGRVPHHDRVGRDVARDHGARAHQRTLADRHAAEDRGIAANRRGAPNTG